MTRSELEDLSRSELIALCKERNITIPKYARKSLLIDDILEYQEEKITGSYTPEQLLEIEEYGCLCNPKRYGE